MQIIPVPTACPKCGANLWDNRTTKKNPKAPDFKCRIATCDGVHWAPKNGGIYADQAGVAPQAPVAAAPSAPQAYYANASTALPGEFSATVVEQKYAAELDFVLTQVVPKLEAKDIPIDMAGINAAVATLLIQARG